MSSPIIDVAEELTAIINALPCCSGSGSPQAERTYIMYDRLERINETRIWVQPVEQEIEAITRDKDKHAYLIDIGIFSRCKLDSEIDDLMSLAHEIYLGIRRSQFSTGQKTVNVENPVIISPDQLSAHNLFAATMQVRILDMLP
jgi:hypothetical protein